MTGHTHLTFGARGSALARCQTDLAAQALQQTHAGLTTECIIFSTRGDQNINDPLPQIGGKGLFTAELEAALLRGEIDLAVHSLKDLPTEDAPGLTIGAVLYRENPADALVSRKANTLDTLPAKATIGTSSLRRAAQLLAYRPDLQIMSIRGNVDTRVNKALDPNGAYDGIILAVAGLARMELTQNISQYLPLELMLPAPGQGAIAVQCRADDSATLSRLAAIHHLPTYQTVWAEREFLAALGGGCSLPVGTLGTIAGDMLSLQVVVASPDGQQVIRLVHRGKAARAQEIGQAAARQAIERGAQAILEAVHA
jgi:hydroxymethylbilane synthase